MGLHNLRAPDATIGPRPLWLLLMFREELWASFGARCRTSLSNSSMWISGMMISLSLRLVGWPRVYQRRRAGRSATLPLLRYPPAIVSPRWPDEHDRPLPTAPGPRWLPSAAALGMAGSLCCPAVVLPWLGRLPALW